jgi:hypothetical protein
MIRDLSIKSGSMLNVIKTKYFDHRYCDYCAEMILAGQECYECTMLWGSNPKYPKWYFFFNYHQPCWFGKPFAAGNANEVLQKV